MRKRVTKSNAVPVAAAPSTGMPARIPTWLIAVLLALVTVTIYWPATHHDFVRYDDDLFVTANTHVQKGLSWENVKWAFVTPVACIWHPLTTLSHMADCQVFGLKPWGHHLTSILLHAFNTALVFLFLRSLTGAFWRSAMVAALFGVHPSHVESVAWVAERKDVLCATFGLLTLIFYTRFALQQSKVAENQKAKAFTSGSYWLAALFLLLGLMSKPMLVTWPFVMLLLDYWPLARFKHTSTWRLVAEKIPFLVVAMVASGIAFAVQKQGGAVAGVDALPFGARAGNAVISLCRYLGMQLWPQGLAVFYPHPGYWPMAKVLIAATFIASMTAVLLLQRQRFPFLLTGWLWFCGTMVPVIGLVQVGDQALADRYTYLPTLGIFVCVVWGMHEFILSRRKHWSVPALAASVAVIACVTLARQQITYWHDTEALFRHALAVTKDNHIAHCQLGAVLEEQGQLDEAMAHFQEAIRLKPGYADARNNLGTVLGMKGRLEEAITELREATRLKPDSASAHNNLGHALGIKGNVDEAVSELQEAVRLNPDFPEARRHLGTAFLSKGDLEGAIKEFRECLKFQANNAEVHNSLGAAYFSKGDLDAAIAEFKETLRLDPNHSGASNNLVNALEKKSAPTGR